MLLSGSGRLAAAARGGRRRTAADGGGALVLKMPPLLVGCCCCTVSDACVWHVCTLAATFQEETDCERESPALARDGGEIAFPQPVVSAWVSLGAMTLTNFVI